MALSLRILHRSKVAASKHVQFRKLMSSFPEITEEDRFKFDLEGFLVVKNVFTKEEVAAANQAIDKRESEMKERQGVLRNTKQGTSLAGDGKTGRMDLGGMLSWPTPDRDVFRSLLTHSKLIPYFHAFLGEGYRLDHLPLLVTQKTGAEGFHLHGGPYDSEGNPDFFLSYNTMKGKIRTSLLGCALQLSDVGPGEGGFCVLKGSHKANFKVPSSIIHGDKKYLDMLYQPISEAGDVVFFSEATTHGSLAWSGKHDRRTAIYRFSPSNFGYSRSYHPEWPEGMYDDITEAEKAVLEPPYNNRLDRPYISGYCLQGSEDGLNKKVKINVEIQSRAQEKKAFDKQVFKNEFF